MKKVISLMLALAMVLALCACGGKTETAGTQPSANKPASDAAQPEYVYNADIKSIELTGTNDRYERFTAFGYSDGRFLGVDTAGEYVSNEDGGSKVVQTTNVAEFTSDGKLNLLFPLVAKEYDINPKCTCTEDINFIFKTDDGYILMTQATLGIVPEDYEGESDGEEFWNTVEYKYHNYLDVYDNEGNLVKSSEIDYQGEAAYGFFITSATINSKGNIVCCTFDGIFELSGDAEILNMVPIAGYYVDSILTLPDGRIVAPMSENSGNYKLYEIDTDKGTSTPISDDLGGDAYRIYNGAGDFDILYSGGSGLYGYNIAEGKSSRIFDWVDVDMMYPAEKMNIDKDGNIIMFNALYEGDETGSSVSYEYITVKKQPYDPATAKQVLTIAGLYDLYDINKQIMKFNRSNDKYKLVYKAYYDSSASDGDEQSVKASIDRLKTEMMAGDCPDMLLLSYLPVDFFSARGLLEDLYPYLDADKEYSRDKILPNVLTALESNGKLYQIAPVFSLRTLMASSMIVGTEPGWNFDDVTEALSMMPEGCTLTMKGENAKNYVDYCINRDFSDYVDWTTGKVHLDTPEFKKILESAKALYPYSVKITDDSMGWDPDIAIKEGLQLCKDSTISSFTACMGDASVFNGLPTLIGFPGSGSNTGSFLNFYNGVGICSASKNKDACWEFVRMMLSDKTQKSLGSFPINKEIIEKKLKDACTVNYKKDSSGNIILDKNGEPVKIERLFLYDGTTGGLTMFYALDEEYGNTIYDIITSTTTVYHENDTIVNIVVEEMAAYFEGQKSLDDVCKVMQSKASIYMNEQM